MRKNGDDSAINGKVTVPILPLRDSVIFPGMVMPIYIGRKKSVNAVDKVNENKEILVLPQLIESVEDPVAKDLNKIGTICRIIHIQELPANSFEILAEGKKRVKLLEFIDREDYNRAVIDDFKSVILDKKKLEIVLEKIYHTFQKLREVMPHLSNNVADTIAALGDPEKLIDSIAGFINFSFEDKLIILNTEDIIDRGSALLEFINKQIELVDFEKNLEKRVKKNIDKHQREYYLNEQLKTIKKELGHVETDNEQYQEVLKKIKFSPEAKSKFSKELARLEKLPSISPESGVIRSYLDTLIDLPWGITTKDNTDLISAAKVLDAHHHGLDKIKERILEFLAVKQLNKNNKGPILCFVGPPGTGKTSLAVSIAEALNRKYVKIALGGVRDEAEIRGHRRTYIGSMPGRVIQALRKSKSLNPLFLLDEIDKMSADFRGDPASALLEVLDPEQNKIFADHYLEVEFDLSHVLFIATANSPQGIPEALKDRMEIIPISGYTELEKVHIAKQFLIPRQQIENGLDQYDIRITTPAIKEIIHSYTREAGVRSLEKEISKIFRKLARQLVEKKITLDRRLDIGVSKLEEFLKVRRYQFTKFNLDYDEIGVSMGLAWTEFGGDTLPIEAVKTPGKGELILTGRLGEVMRESAQTAYTYIKSRSDIEEKSYQKSTIHLHFPEGAIPKDGPSAGITIATALYSLLKQVKVKHTVSMTGEISLRGRVLPIGGLKEKVLASLRAGVKEIIIPYENEKDLTELSDEIKSSANFHIVATFDKVIEVVIANNNN